MKRSTVMLGLLLAAAMPACGGGPTAIVAPSTTSTTPPAPTTTTTVPPTTTTTASTATACPPAALPAAATGVSTAAGNFDGDGHADTLQAYKAGGAWHLRTQLTAGGGGDVTVADVAAVETVKAVGGFNIDANLLDEVFATVTGGAYTTQLKIWKLSGCQPTRLTVKGEPSTFPVGASVLNRAGVRCVAGTAIQVLEAQGDSAGTVFKGVIANYDVVGTTLVLANTSPPQTLAASDPTLAAYGSFTCGSLKL